MPSPSMTVENPLKKLKKLGRLSPAIPESEDDDKVNGEVVVRYEMYDVSDPTEKQMLCDAKAKILKHGYPYSEQSTFDKEGTWIVALNWYEDAEPEKDGDL